MKMNPAQERIHEQLRYDGDQTLNQLEYELGDYLTRDEIEHELDAMVEEGHAMRVGRHYRAVYR